MKLFTVTEIAEILKINKNAVYELINSGELPAIKGIGRLKVSEDDLRKFIEKNKEWKILENKNLEKMV